VPFAVGKYEEAEMLNRRALAAQEKLLGCEHSETLSSVYCLAFQHKKLDNFASALRGGMEVWRQAAGA